MIISIIIPTFGRQDFLNRALQSIENQSASTKLEIIVVNDGPVTPYLSATSLPIRLIETGGNKGVSFGRNIGAQAASGTYLAFLDDDDFWAPDFLKTMLEAMKNSNADFSFCGLVDMFEDGSIATGKLAPTRITPEMFFLKNYGITGSNLVIRNVVFEKIGGFDPRLYASNDMDIVIRLLKEGFTYVRCPQRLVYRHEHAGPRITTSSLKLKSTLRFYFKHRSSFQRCAIHRLKRISLLLNLERNGKIRLRSAQRLCLGIINRLGTAFCDRFHRFL